MFVTFPGLLRNDELLIKFTLNYMEIQTNKQLPEACQCFNHFARLRTRTPSET